ncbi:Uncharacterized protein OBRU01_14415 [Operophtera brumata]|uniref:MADF domain-containing protein n=1 Tax=Operophtera brumata TaxID=104452 RepID=A0A0L7KW71_OPEBR|nr:Uncharacterized protein OBRU01_14415 [Operophtera brumata]
MSTQWSNDRELVFLECYQAEPVLWQAQHEGHQNKNKTHDAWTRISAIMEIPVPDLKKKRDSLMSSYRTYRKKVKDSIHSGASTDEVYKPIWFAYETMDSFLGEGVACNKTINSEQSANNETNEEAQEAGPSRNINSQQMISKTIRRRNNPSELLIAGETVKDCLSTLKTTLSARQPQEDDECDLHARSEIPGYFSPAQTYVSSQSPSPQQQLRATSSRSTYSEPPMQQQRGTSSRSTYSEPPMQQQRAPIQQRIYSESLPFHSPVIHIPEEAATAGDSPVIIISNELIPKTTEDYTDYTNDTSDQPNEGPTDYDNLIDKAFKFS